MQCLQCDYDFKANYLSTLILCILYPQSGHCRKRVLSQFPWINNDWWLMIDDWWWVSHCLCDSRFEWNWDVCESNIMLLLLAALPCYIYTTCYKLGGCHVSSLVSLHHLSTLDIWHHFPVYFCFNGAVTYSSLWSLTKSFLVDIGKFIHLLISWRWIYNPQFKHVRL